MYLRHTTIRKNGKTHTYWRLVKSVRIGRGVKQVTVCQLGELDEDGRLAARQLADTLVGVERQPGLFDDPVPTEPISLQLAQLQLERGRRFGDVWLALKVWQALRLDELFEQLIPSGQEHVPWPVMAAILVVARLCEPSSKLALAENWFRKTALGDLLGVSEEKINDDRLYRALDELLPHKDAVERHLKERFGTLFGLEYDLLLYDITSTYFEGLHADAELAKRGYSRDHRSDCLQVCIGLVVTRDGFPLGYEVFAGNRNDSTTLREVIERMESKYGRRNRIWAVDRGMVSEEHLQWLRARGSRYIVGTHCATPRGASLPRLSRAGMIAVRMGARNVCQGSESLNHEPLAGHLTTLLALVIAVADGAWLKGRIPGHRLRPPVTHLPFRRQQDKMTDARQQSVGLQLSIKQSPTVMRMANFIRYVAGSLPVLAACLGTVLAADPPADTDTPAARLARLEYLKSRAAECEISKEGKRDQPLQLTKEPLLRYSNPVRGFLLSDGATFLWLDGERPMAVATWSIRGPGNVFREMTSLCAEPLSCIRDDRVIWSPKTGGLVNQLLPEAAAPLSSAARRLGQMRTLASRFSGVVHLPPDETTITELRLLSQPIHRYKQETPEVLDGALFSFAEATDPEVLLLLEAKRGKAEGEYEWRYTLARMTSVLLIMRLDGKECWSVTNFWRSPKSPSDPYVESADGKYTAEK